MVLHERGSHQSDWTYLDFDKDNENEENMPPKKKVLESVKLGSLAKEMKAIA